MGGVYQRGVAHVQLLLLCNIVVFYFKYNCLGYSFAECCRIATPL